MSRAAARAPLLSARKLKSLRLASGGQSGNGCHCMWKTGWLHFQAEGVCVVSCLGWGVHSRGVGSGSCRHRNSRPWSRYGSRSFVGGRHREQNHIRPGVRRALGNFSSHQGHGHRAALARKHGSFWGGRSLVAWLDWMEKMCVCVWAQAWVEEGSVRESDHYMTAVEEDRG